jgi:cell division protein FtsA
MIKNYICALDIGSSKIAACLAVIQKKQITDIFLESLPAKGVKRGSIVDSIELVTVVGRVLKNLKAKSGISIKSVLTNISGQDIITKHSRALIPLAERGNKVITSSDIDKVNKQAFVLGSSIEDEIIRAIPFGYCVDSKSGIANPQGLYGHKLEVDLYLICGKLSYVQTVTHVINQAGFESKELFFSGLATSEALFNQELKRGTNIICDIGSDITELLLFKDGLLKEVKIFSFGGSDLTTALSDALNIPWDLAEDIKVSHGVIGEPGQIKQDQEVLVKKDNVYKPIKQRLISEIITARAQSICQSLKDSLEKMEHFLEINNFIFTGRTMLQEGFLEMFEKSFGILTEIGRINQPQIAPFLNKKDALAGRKYLTYLTCLGLICKELHAGKPKIPSPVASSRHPVLKFIDKAKEIYQEYF